MKRWIALCLMGVLLCTLCGCKSIVMPGSSTEPPQIDARYGEEVAELTSPSYHWETTYLDFSKVYAIADSVAPSEMKDLKEFLYDPTMEVQEVRLCFKKAPERVSVQCLDTSSEYASEGELCVTVLSEKEEGYAACYSVALKEGAQLYQVGASWEDGTASYWFRTTE